MTRSLPWKRSGGAKASADLRRADSPARSPIASRAATPRAPTPAPRSASSSKPKSVARHSLSAKRGRSPSTSPPPEPPVESFMIEGVENDDRWRMVEDEFLSTANTFTVHLHAAEYHRLKGLAKEQNADTINSISRPVTGVMTSSVKRRQDVLARLRKQREGLKRSRANMDQPVEDEDAPWAGTSLQGLMDSPRKRSIPLTSVTSTVPGTRAAAGFQESTPSKGSARYVDRPEKPRALPLSSARKATPTTEDSDDSDDLDGPVRRQSALQTSSSSAAPRRSLNYEERNIPSPSEQRKVNHRMMEQGSREDIPVANRRSPEPVESDNPDNGLLRSISKRRRRTGNRGRPSLHDTIVKQEGGE